MKNYDLIIVGAGAAGMMCAIEAAKRKKKVLLLDKADKAGKKILISGGGRCNFTNLYIEPSSYISNNPHFCKSALSRYTQWDIIALLEQHALTWTEKTLGQLFCDQKSKAVVTMLLDECEKSKVTLQLSTNIQSINKNDVFNVATDAGDFQAASLVIATGGASIPRMGSSDFALRIAKQFGIKNIPFHAGLVPLIFSQADINHLFKGLAGVAFDAIVSCNNTSFKEAVLITHKGLSGPAILQISSYWHKGDPIYINLLPDNNAVDWLLEQKNQHPRKELLNVLSEKIPKRLAQKFTEIYFPSYPIEQMTNKKLQEIGEKLNNWELHPSGTEGMRTAEVCLGGISTDELSSKTFESKKVSGLYFIGEAVDVTGWLGGYNFQWAWASGWCAGQYV